MEMLRRNAWLAFLLVALLVTLFGVFPGGWLEEGADPGESLLMSSFAAVAVVLTVAVASGPLRRGEYWAWWALWIWPVFFVVHAVAFFVVDWAFAALTAGALLVTRPQRRRARVEAA